MSEIAPGVLGAIMSENRRSGFVFEDEGVEKEVKYTTWSSGDGQSFYPSTKPTQILTPGVYEIKNNPSRGTYFQKTPVNVDGLVKFEDSVFSEVTKEIAKFWVSESLYKKYGLMHKRGILLYGPPGSGKTSLVQMIMSDVIKRGGVVLKFENPNIFPEGIRSLREIQPNTPVVVLMEDIEAIIDYWSESQVLNILDGVNRVDKVVFISTTNYPEKLGDRIINRPSRFDKRFKVGHPSERSRKIYLEHLVRVGGKNVKVDVRKWVKDTENMSIAHIKELFTAVMIIGDKYDDAISTLRSMKEDAPSSEDDSIKSLGFGVGQDE